ncbi:hypothetical protein IQ07DRAFT_627147 [Pyrenochaeta sp. DS3sAY3a]|nr:hypothetical protein IQ07DRAFT_627147 [Pyrenochaeta sp. DS3sAY3a]
MVPVVSRRSGKAFSRGAVKISLRNSEAGKVAVVPKLSTVCQRQQGGRPSRTDHTVDASRNAEAVERTGARTAALPLSQNEGPSSTPQLVQYELPQYVTAQGSLPTENVGGSGTLEEVRELIVSLKETIVQQSNVIANQNTTIESIQTNIETSKAGQQYLKNQNAELQEIIGSLRAQLDTLSGSPPSTQTWASVVASGGPAGSGTALSRVTSSGRTDKEQHRQLVVDISRAGEETVEKVANTETVKRAIQQGMNGVERLVGATIRDFHWIEVPLAMDADTGKVSQSAMERFGTENGVEVCTMRWLGRPRPSGQHASVVIKVATKEDAKKLLRRFGHRARDCLRPETCDMCGQEGHLHCEATNLRYVNARVYHVISAVAKYDTQIYLLAYRNGQFNGFVSTDKDGQPWSPPGRETLRAATTAARLLREKERAERAADQASRQEARRAAKRLSQALKTSQKGKKRSLKASTRVAKPIGSGEPAGAATAVPLVQSRRGRKINRPIELSTKRSRNNSHCTWLYSLKFSCCFGVQSDRYAGMIVTPSTSVSGVPLSSQPPAPVRKDYARPQGLTATG